MPATIPGLPTGLPVATYDDYARAQAAVDHLSDEKFPIERLAIVGSDLRQVERVTGRLTWGKAALTGAASGAWLGLFVGLILALFATVDGILGVILMSVLWGALFFAIFGLVGYWMSGGRRDFTSSSAIIPSSFVIYCHHQHAEDARERLARFDLGSH